MRVSARISANPEEAMAATVMAGKSHMNLLLFQMLSHKANFLSSYGGGGYQQGGGYSGGGGYQQGGGYGGGEG
jgi:hypothetical protein